MKLKLRLAELVALLVLDLQVCQVTPHVLPPLFDGHVDALVLGHLLLDVLLSHCMGVRGLRQLAILLEHLSCGECEARV